MRSFRLVVSLVLAAVSLPAQPSSQPSPILKAMEEELQRS